MNGLEEAAGDRVQQRVAEAWEGAPRALPNSSSLHWGPTTPWPRATRETVFSSHSK